MALESGWGIEQRDRHGLTEPMPSPPIPATLQDSLIARLDRLGTARDVAHSQPC